jgi:hypothetical protein
MPRIVDSRATAGPRPGRAALALTLTLLAGLGLATGRPTPAAEPRGGEPLDRWKYYQEIPRPSAPAGGAAAGAGARLYDFAVTPAVFDGARADLGDLRLYDSAGKEVPYALRIRRPDFRTEVIPARSFNRSRDAEGAGEVTLDLGEGPGEHNDVEVQMPGANYRRHARLEGSDDGKTWRTLAEKDLLRFNAGRQSLDDRRLPYPPSRYRYLRVRVERDPQADDEDRPVELDAVIVRRRVEVPGEFLELPAPAGPREAVPADGGPGSAWVFDLGGDHVPCDRLAVDLADAEFVRNYHVEAGGRESDEGQPFLQVGQGLWRRRAGDPRTPVIAEFGEVAAGRLRLVVTDHRNPPLNLRGATFRAAMRQVVFADPGPGVTSLRLYFGNPDAASPQYDFERNLPATLDPPPVRLALAPAGRVDNPTYLPEPKPFTERWPWLIYAILAAISLGLGVIIIGLARTAIRLHDARLPAAAAAMAGPGKASPAVDDAEGV